MPDNLTYKKMSTYDEDAKFFYQYFIQKGYSPVASAGIVGNLIHESTGGSGVNTKIENGIGAFGAAQWLNERRTALNNFASRMGLSPSDRKAQADFLLHELNTTHTKAKIGLQNAKTVDEASNVFLNKFEIPGKHDTSGPSRAKYANQIYREGVDKNELWNGSSQIPNNKMWFDNLEFGKNSSGLKDNTFKVMSILKKKFPSLNVTSTVRKASQGVGKNSKTSRHNIGEAFDIAAQHKDVFDYLNTQEGLTLLDRYGLGVLDETDPATMRKTGATGAHFHIGADSKLVANTRNKLLSFNGSVTGNPNSTPVNNDEHEHSHSENEVEGYRPSEGGLSNSYILESLNSLSEKIENKNQQDLVDLKNQEVKNKLIQKQKERDFLVAQTLSVNLPFVERGY